LAEDNINVTVGDTAYLQAIITPANADNQDITWRVSPTGRFVKLNQKDTLTATLTSSKEGTYTVTATLGDFTAECTVTFSPATDVEDLTISEEGTYKFIRDGQVQILHEGKSYGIKGEKL
jgi:uncharacterized protein YjdB